eukprot:TRINITY_DN7885_c0_g2_i1.p1 TRINITY_DN7885_c0_g2~~TRINITY_DN7885_c0_g2_i1.p1  ORF type:complete len:274 (-),score=39.12 TRINITY_DN7885_c0_g2_i1:278-1099(-)
MKVGNMRNSVFVLFAVGVLGFCYFYPLFSFFFIICSAVTTWMYTRRTTDTPVLPPVKAVSNYQPSTHSVCLNDADREKELKEKYGYCWKFLPQIQETERKLSRREYSPILDAESCSPQTATRALATSKYITNFYKDLFQYRALRTQRLKEVKRQVSALPKEEQQNWIFAQNVQESAYLRLRRSRTSIRDFQIIALIGRGGYGEVFLVKKRDTGELLALKRMSKEHYTNKNAGRAILEKEVLKVNSNVDSFLSASPHPSLQNSALNLIQIFLGL